MSPMPIELSPGHHTKWKARLSNIIFSTGAFLPGLTKHIAQEVKIGTFPPSQDEMRQLVQASRSWLPVDILISHQLLHHQTITLPVSASSQAKSAIDIALRQKLPAQGSGLNWVFEKIGRKHKKFEYLVHLCKKDVLVGLQELVTEAGGLVRSISIASSSAPAFVDFRTKTDRPARIWGIISFISVAIALTASIFVLETRASKIRNETEVLNQKILQLQDQAINLQENENLRKEEEDILLDDFRSFLSVSNRSYFISEISNALKEGVWISEIYFHKDKVYMSGFSSQDISELINALQSIDGFNSVDLDGPVTLDSLSGENRFSVLIEINMENGVQH